MFEHGSNGLLDRYEPDIFKGAVAGLLAGLAATWVMTQFQNAVPQEMFAELLGESDGSRSDGSGEDESEPATVEAAEAVSETVFDHPLTKSEKKVAGPAVHYSVGSSGGIAYGVLAEFAPRVTSAGGLPFGTAFWLLADELAVPAVGLSEAPWKHAPSTHAYSLVAHLVYGVSTEAFRRLVRRTLN